MFLALAVVYGCILLSASAIGYRKGSRPLMTACASVGIGWLSSVLLVRPQAGWKQVQVGIMGTDVCVLIALSSIAVMSKRRWAMVSAAAQLAAISIHVGFAADKTLWFPAYAGALQTCSWAVLLAIAIGSLTETKTNKT